MLFSRDVMFVSMYQFIIGDRLMMASRLLAAALLVLPACVSAQEQGDAQQGRIYASQVCAECHKIGSEDGLSPVIGVKSFKEIANQRDTTVISLAAWMQSEHVNMPHIVPEAHELNDVIAYIVRLKD
jgi:mono/diheme cytochrome c family protein